MPTIKAVDQPIKVAGTPIIDKLAPKKEYECYTPSDADSTVPKWSIQQETHIREHFNNCSTPDKITAFEDVVKTNPSSNLRQKKSPQEKKIVKDGMSEFLSDAIGFLKRGWNQNYDDDDEEDDVESVQDEDSFHLDTF